MTRRFSPVPMQQIMDIRAALLASLFAGLIYLLVQIIMAVWLFGSTPWVVLRWQAGILLGESVLPPPADFTFVPVLVGLLLHFALSLLYGLLIAFIIHRGGLLVGIVGGGLIGLALYALNFYTFTILFPWFFAIRNWLLVVGHVLFGMLVGGIYEALEVEKFVPVED